MDPADAPAPTPGTDGAAPAPVTPPAPVETPDAGQEQIPEYVQPGTKEFIDLYRAVKKEDAAIDAEEAAEAGQPKPAEGVTDPNAKPAAKPGDGQPAAKPEGSDAPVEAAKPFAGTLALRAVGADHSFDLTKPEDLETVKALVSRGLQADHLIAKADERASTLAGDKYTSFLTREGILREAEVEGKKVLNFDPMGGAKWLKGLVTKVYAEKAPEVLRQLSTTFAEGTESPAGSIEATLEGIAKGLDPEFPEDEKLIKVIDGLKGLAGRLAATEARLQGQLKPVTDTFTRQEQERKDAEQRAAQERVDKEWGEFHEGEFKKYPVLAKPAHIDEKDWKVLHDVHIRMSVEEAQRLKAGGMDGKKALAQATKWLADLEARKVSGTNKDKALAEAGAMPKPAAPPPSASGRGTSTTLGQPAGVDAPAGSEDLTNALAEHVKRMKAGAAA